MSFILWIVLGAGAGWIASLIMNTDHKQGFILNIVVGVLGAMIGGFLFNQFGGAGVTGFNLYSLLVAIVGACTLLAVVKLIRG